MIRYVDENLTPITSFNWTYQNVQYPPNIFQNFTEEELKTVGIFTVQYDEVPTPEGKQIVDYTYGWEGENAVATPVFEDIPIVVPQSVSRAQGKAALLSFDLLDGVENYIQSMPEGVDKKLATLAFNETNEWQRNSTFLQQMATSLGLTSEQLDNLFIVAATIIL